MMLCHSLGSCFVGFAMERTLERLSPVLASKFIVLSTSRYAVNELMLLLLLSSQSQWDPKLLQLDCSNWVMNDLADREAPGVEQV
jgi:hypothetical protein